MDIRLKITYILFRTFSISFSMFPLVAVVVYSAKSAVRQETSKATTTTLTFRPDRTAFIIIKRIQNGVMFTFSNLIKTAVVILLLLFLSRFLTTFPPVYQIIFAFVIHCS